MTKRAIRTFTSSSGHMHIAALSGLLFALAVSVAGCEHVRRVTYPPEFTYLTDATVSTSMGRMARHVARLEALMGEAPTEQAIDRGAVIAELRQLQDVARSLGAGPAATNHLLVDAHVDRFSQSLDRARRAVEHDPPSYYLVGQVTGSCSACHLYR